MKKLGASALAFLCVHILCAQSIKTFDPLLDKYPLGSKPDLSSLRKIADPPSLVYDAMYSVRYDGSKTLYGRPIQNIAIGISDDTIASIALYVPFDTTLHKEIERDLGTPELGWMGFARGTDTSGIIWTRYWDLPKYSVGFKCTRYQYQMGERKEDWIAISLICSRKKQSF